MGFSIDAVVREHIREYERTTAGWGRTKECVAKLKDGLCTWQNSGLEEGLGNGVVMKIAPLAFWFAHVHHLPEESCITSIERLACLTHRNPVCVASAVIHCCALTRLFSPAGCVLDTLAQRYQFIAWLTSRADSLEPIYRLCDSPYRLSVRLKRLLALAPNEPTDAQILDIAQGGGYNAVDSLMVVYGVLLKCGPNFEAILHTASLGGNTDSNCSMIGSIVGGLRGVAALPRQYVDALLMHDAVIQVGEQLGTLVETLKPGPRL